MPTKEIKQNYKNLKVIQKKAEKEKKGTKPKWHKQKTNNNMIF